MRGWTTGEIDLGGIVVVVADRVRRGSDVTIMVKESKKVVKEEIKKTYEKKIKNQRH